VPSPVPGGTTRDAWAGFFSSAVLDGAGRAVRERRGAPAVAGWSELEAGAGVHHRCFAAVYRADDLL